MELVQTERQYHEDLKLLINAFKKPLSRSGTISPTDIGKVFANIQEVCKVHENIVEGLSTESTNITEIISILLDNVRLIHIRI